MSSCDNLTDKCLASVFMLIIAIVLFMAGAHAGADSMKSDSMKSDAIEKGLAEYVADKDGNVEFQWKENK